MWAIQIKNIYDEEGQVKNQEVFVMNDLGFQYKITSSKNAGEPLARGELNFAETANFIISVIRSAQNLAILNEELQKRMTDADFNSLKRKLREIAGKKEKNIVANEVFQNYLDKVRQDDAKAREVRLRALR